MKLFVESWDDKLKNTDGTISKGYEAFISHDERYKSRGRNLFIHYLEVGSIKKDDLKAHFDSNTNQYIEGRRALSGCNWWLCKSPRAYAFVENEKVRAKLSQVK